MSEAAISCKGVTFSYLETGKDILKETNLVIPQGRITVLMGSSGCGKSTLAAVCCGLLPENGGTQKSGEIRLFGRSISEIPLSERAAYISMMFQNPDLQFCMPTLREELIFCAENISMAKDAMDAAVEAAAGRMGTTHLLDRPLYTLSGGEKQRAVLTCIFLLDSKCIILDEAFANLDPAAVKDLIPVFEALCHEEGKTILAIDHMSDHWQGVDARFVLMGTEGKVLAEVESAEALEAVRPIFVEEGIAYPGIWEKKTVANAGTGTNYIELRNFTLSGVQGKKPLFGRIKRVDSTNRLQGETLYHQANMDIPKGKITAIMGRSGCGKTTLMMTLLKQRDYSGTIRLIDGQTRELKSISRKDCFDEIGIAFQNPSNQFVTQNVLEEIVEGLKRRYPSEPEKALEERGLKMLETCGLKRYRKFSPYMLSQGQQRRLAVLAVLAAGQKLLLLDEPTYGQDYRSATALMDMIEERVREDGLTVIMSTHDAGLAGAYADVIIRVENKKLASEVV